MRALRLLGGFASLGLVVVALATVLTAAVLAVQPEAARIATATSRPSGRPG